MAGTTAILQLSTALRSPQVPPAIPADGRAAIDSFQRRDRRRFGRSGTLVAGEGSPEEETRRKLLRHRKNQSEFGSCRFKCKILTVKRGVASKSLVT